MNFRFIETKLNCLAFVPWEEWCKHSINLVRVNCDSNGFVHSGIIVEQNQFIWFSNINRVSKNLSPLYRIEKK